MGEVPKHIQKTVVGQVRGGDDPKPFEREGIQGVTPEERFPELAALRGLEQIARAGDLDAEVSGGFIGEPQPLDPSHPDADRIIG